MDLYASWKVYIELYYYYSKLLIVHNYWFKLDLSSLYHNSKSHSINPKKSHMKFNTGTQHLCLKDLGHHFKAFSGESLSCPWELKAEGETDFAALKIDVGV